MTPYSFLLFDADNTLFNFDAGNRRAFSEVCRICQLPDTDELFHAYETVNAEMWSAFDRGECTKDFLVVERFRLFLERAGLQADPVRCNKIHLSTLATNTVLLPHALEYARMGLIPAGSHLNRTHCAPAVDVAPSVDEAVESIVFDAQTSGGIVLAVPGEELATVRDWLEARGEMAVEIGEVLEARSDGKRLLLR